jgi:uncharacterized repeat protein (TIGR01451 family)
MKILYTLLLTCWALNTVVAQFGPSYVLVNSTQEQCSNATKADLDQDGDDDVLARYDGRIIVHWFDGGNVSQAIISVEELPNNNNWITPIVADMDGDADFDIVLENRWLENVELTFTTVHTYYDENSDEFWTSCGDLNNDGSMDMLLFNPSVNQPESMGFYALLNDGTGAFTSNAVYAEGVHGSRMELADMNCDGFLDMVYMNNAQNNVVLCSYNDGSGSFYEPIAITDYYVFVSWVLADFNGDGNVDLAIEGYTDHQLKVYYNTGSGIPLNPIIYNVPLELHVMQGDLENRATDYDGDGDLDLMLDESSSVYWMENTPDGFVWSDFIMERPVNQPDLIWIDINGDNLMDAVGTYAQLVIYVQGVNGEQMPIGVECNQCAYGPFIYKTDMDNDTNLDFTTVNSYGIHNLDLNNYGGFQQNTFMADMGFPNYINKRFIDIDLDGDLDMTYIAVSSSTGTYYLNAFLNNGMNNFNHVYQYLAFENSLLADYTSIDYDLDGVNDLVTVQFIDETMSVLKYKYQSDIGWQNDGVLFTQNCGNCASGVEERNSILTGDFNGDSFMDISLVRLNNGFIFEGDGVGNYSPVDVLGNTNEDVDMQIAVADFDNDGRDDVLYHSMIYNPSSYTYISEKLKIIKYNGSVYSVATAATASNIVDAVNEDFDLDGDIDLVYGVRGNPTQLFLKYNAGNGTFGSPVQLNLEIQNYALEDIETADIDGDNMMDLLYTVSSIYFPEDAWLNATANILDSPYKIEYHVFIDDNANGILDEGESGLANTQIALSDDLGYLYTNDLGEYTYFGLPGEITSAINLNIELWTATTAWTQTVLLGETNPVVQVYFGLIPNGFQPSAEGTVTNLGGVCSGYESHWISVTNTGNTIASGQITYELDPLFTFSEAFPAPDVVAGNTLTWNYSDLYYGNTIEFVVDVVPPSVDYLGQTVYNTLTTTVQDSSGSVIHTHTLTDEQLIACSLIPNELVENNGVTSSGYILPDGELEYTVFFENDGNANAINIHIEDMLSSQLDLSTLHFVAASHDYDMTVSEDGLLVASFIGINLPYTDMDPSASHGFFTFRIKPIAGLPAGTVITNQATVYFDLNPGMATNITLNTIYDCIDLQQGTVSETSVCTGEEITCNNNATWIENLTWSFNGNDVGTGNYTHTVNESGTLTMHAANALCDYTQDFQLTANTANASFTSNGNTLTANDAASYQWFLNGNEIAGATQQTYEITETGNYSMMVVDANGCDGVSEEQSLTYTSILINQIGRFEVYPIPAKDKIKITLDASLVGEKMDVINASGQTIIAKKTLRDTTIYVEVDGWDAGVYVVVIGHAREVFLIE